MKIKSLLLTSLVWFQPSLFAADHIDGNAAVNEAGADITDLYTWMSKDSEKLVLVLNVLSGASSSSKFSDAIQYAFHIESQKAFGAESPVGTDIICSFDFEQKIQCWAGEDYATGDANAPSGLTSYKESFKVFAGPRKDSFFMDFSAFLDTQAIVQGAFPTLAAALPDSSKWNEAMCPNINGILGDGTTAALRNTLTDLDSQGGSNFFADNNVLSIVMEIDKSMVTKGGDILSIWASTHKK